MNKCVTVCPLMMPKGIYILYGSAAGPISEWHGRQKIKINKSHISAKTYTACLNSGLGGYYWYGSKPANQKTKKNTHRKCLEIHLQGSYYPHIFITHLHGSYYPHIFITHLQGSYYPHIFITHLQGSYYPHIFITHLQGSYYPHIFITHLQGSYYPHIFITHLQGSYYPHIFITHTYNRSILE